jgi:hypothetical protein
MVQVTKYVWYFSIKNINNNTTLSHFYEASLK